jgi:ABC-type methionine transport system permease subunit
VNHTYLAGTFGTLFGLPLGIFLATSRAGELFPAPAANRILGLIVNATRSTPFIILVVAIVPLTRLIADYGDSAFNSSLHLGALTIRERLLILCTITVMPEPPRLRAAAGRLRAPTEAPWRVLRIGRG